MGTMKVDEPFGPAVPSIPLSSSPLALVVAQVQFPLVASIAESAFIGPFQEAVRETYSELREETQAQVLIGPDGVQPGRAATVWRFSDPESEWQLALAPEFMALATNSYSNRDDFLARLRGAIDALSGWLHPKTARRVGVRYVDQVANDDLSMLRELVRPEVLGALGHAHPLAKLINGLTQLEYQFDDDGSSLRARWGVLDRDTTFDPTISPVDTRSWILDLDAWHGERPFDPTAILEQVTTFSERIYRYFRWAVTDQFLIAHGADL